MIKVTKLKSYRVDHIERKGTLGLDPLTTNVVLVLYHDKQVSLQS
jgi:hypothetical protein